MKQPTVSQYWRKLEALTQTIGLASSFFPPPLDFWWKEHLCRFSITSKLQYKPVFRFSQPTWHTISKYNQNQPTWHGWLRSRVVSMLDSGAEGPRFKSQLWRCRVTVLGKLFTPILPLFNQAAKLVAALLRVVGVTAGVVESNGSLSPGLWLTSPAGWLQRTGDQLWNATLCNRVWATFTFYLTHTCTWLIVGKLLTSVSIQGMMCSQEIAVLWLWDEDLGSWEHLRPVCCLGHNIIRSQ